MAREEIGLQPRSKTILRHAQQDFDTIFSEVFLFSLFFSCQEKPLLSGYFGLFKKERSDSYSNPILHASANMILIFLLLYFTISCTSTCNITFYYRQHIPQALHYIHGDGFFPLWITGLDLDLDRSH